MANNILTSMCNQQYINLVFVGATSDQKFRAFDKKTGELLWETTLPGNGYASPSTYMIDDKQFIAISVTGTRENPDGSIITFTLPGK